MPDTDLRSLATRLDQQQARRDVRNGLLLIVIPLALSFIGYLMTPGTLIVTAVLPMVFGLVLLARGVYQLSMRNSPNGAPQ